MRILTLCLGNICRSPLAEATVRRALEEQGIQAEVDSAGTGNWHAGALPDPRSRQVARAHGLELTHRARKITPEDFYTFDLILAMDEGNLAELRRLAPEGALDRLALIRDFDPQGPGTVPDPYYGDLEDFEAVYQLLERASRGLARQLALEAAPPSARWAAADGGPA
ncbi:protein-tyrosine phosphatase [Deinobacterium chartae]|uniref:protein-tyrosine-phosphatase n=1 Tax=Deinobacterium chartae TaxID=521158 RepID=A0A841I6M5_9DEIO|nr:low molecular weight protein-tyrosine-phosphatase [Deinobacterium chartae]MBB6099485.1 protein-tyrosine phosphatase [Deinobacterium chartae]